MKDRAVQSQVERQFTLRMGKVLKGLSAPMSTGGYVDVSEVPKITLKDSSEAFFEVCPTPDGDGMTKGLKLRRQVESLSELTDRLPKAAFGHGSETKIDPSVRDARQLKATEFDVNIPSEALEQIKSEIKSGLLLETDIALEPYSLNVYEKGGRFLKHKDTPRGNDMIGTLVVCLPSLFEGGRLIVANGIDEGKDGYFSKYACDRATNCWWGKDGYPECEVNPKRVAWSAFFSDADHEIEAVEDGVRITVAYLIRRKDSKDAKEVCPSSLDQDEQRSILDKELDFVLKSDQFLSNGGKLGYRCNNLYASNEEFVNQSIETPLTGFQIRALKGRDLMVAKSADSLGLEVYLIPYLSHQCDGGIKLRLDSMPKPMPSLDDMINGDCDMDAEFLPGRFSDREVVRYFNARENDYSEPDDHIDLWMLDYWQEDTEEKISGEVSFAADGYFGNEASDTTFYVHAVLHIEVPSYSDRYCDEGEEVCKSKEEPPPKKARISLSPS